jgi:peptidoglycan/LPS O-acetylase OafA/YrhL
LAANAEVSSIAWGELVLSIVFILAGAVLLLKGEPQHMLPQKIGATLLVAGALNERLCRWDSALLLELGNASYSIYLIHSFVLAAVRFLPFLHSRASPGVNRRGAIGAVEG